MAIEIKPALIQETPRVRTQINLSFLDYDVCYRVDDVQEGSILAQGWHKHDTDQFLIPLRGQFYLELQGASGVTSTDLVPSRKYRIPARIEHCLLTCGGVLESFLPGSGLPKAPAYLAEEAWTNTIEQEQRALSSRALVAMVVEHTPRLGVSGCDGRVEVDTQVPGTKLGRKVYFAPFDRERKLLYCPHRHNSGHMLVCIAGRAWLAYREPGEAVRTRQMVPGYICAVPPRLPHQMRMERGSVVASHFPAATWLSRDEELEQLDDDWFPLDAQ